MVALSAVILQPNQLSYLQWGIADPAVVVVHQVEWTLSQLVGSCVVGIEHLWQAGMQVSFPGHRKSVQKVVKSAVETLTLAITGWLVQSGARFLNTAQDTKLLHERAFKVTTLIRMNARRLTKPLTNENCATVEAR